MASNPPLSNQSGSSKPAANPAHSARFAASKRLKDALFTGLAFASGLVILLLIFWIGVRLFADSSLTRHKFGWKFLATSVWDVPHEIYGALPFIYGTLISSLVAIVIAVPISVGTSIFLNELRVSKKITQPISYFIELLAAIPSIVYGLWGFLVLCPWLNTTAAPWLSKQFGFLPIFEGPPVLTNMLAAGVILAIMISPFITSVVTEVLRSLPPSFREASLALGANRWETIRSVTLPASRGGIVAATMLGLGRALGETMAVVMVIGNTPQIKASLLQAGYSMPALLANTFNESYTDKTQLSALIEIAFLLFVVTMVINGLARMMVSMMNRHHPGGWKNKRLRDTVDKTLKPVGKIVQYGLALAVGIPVLLRFFTDMRLHGLGAVLQPSAWLLIVVSVVAWCQNSKTLLKYWDAFRLWNQRLFMLLFVLSGAISCLVLGLILSYIAIKGAQGFSLDILTQLPKGPGQPGGGLKSAIFGTLELVAIAAVIGIPIGVLGGIFLAEFKGSKIRNIVRFAADVLSGIPSVVIGLFAYAAFVLPVKHFSALAGSLALSLMMIPTVMRITEEILKLVPDALREASQGLGATRFETIWRVVLPAARSGILTGVILAVARISGETAPLLFTAFGSDQLNWNPTKPVSSLTMKIYDYARAPYDDWVAQAWSGALVLVVIVLFVSLLARITAAKTGERLRSAKH